MGRLGEVLRETRKEVAVGFGVESRSSGRSVGRRALQFFAPFYTTYDEILRARHDDDTTLTRGEIAIAATAAVADTLVLVSIPLAPGLGTAVTKLSTNLISQLYRQ